MLRALSKKDRYDSIAGEYLIAGGPTELEGGSDTMLVIIESQR